MNISDLILAIKNSSVFFYLSVDNILNGEQIAPNLYISLSPQSAEEGGETKQNYGLKVIKLPCSEISNYVKFLHEIRLINMRKKTITWWPFAKTSGR